MSTIPVADISAFTSGQDYAARDAAARNLATTLRTYGCVALTGHGLSQRFIEPSFEVLRAWFARPMKEKLTAPASSGLRQGRGYTALACVAGDGDDPGYYLSCDELYGVVSGSHVLDLRESFQVGDEGNDTEKNVWPPEEDFPGFRAATIQILDRLDILSQCVLEALVLGMSLTNDERKALRRFHASGSNNACFGHCVSQQGRFDTPLDDFPSRCNRDDRGPDPNLYKLLLQESGTRVEFNHLYRDTFVPAGPNESFVYLSLGSLFDRYSNDFHGPAANREVFTPEEALYKLGPERYYIEFEAIVADRDMVYPMASRVEADGEAKYESIEMRELFQHMFPLMDAYFENVGDEDGFEQ